MESPSGVTPTNKHSNRLAFGDVYRLPYSLLRLHSRLLWNLTWIWCSFSGLADTSLQNIHVPKKCVFLYRYVLTSDIKERTKCCLLSAYLFKVIWCMSLSHSARYFDRYCCSPGCMFYCNCAHSLWHLCVYDTLPQCVLCCSLNQPQDDLQYASHSIRDELLPGVDLFSEPHRVHIGATVTSLNFVCHWLFTTGYHITVCA